MTLRIASLPLLICSALLAACSGSDRLAVDSGVPANPAAGATPAGLCVLDVWESAEKFQAFGEKLMPLIQQAGLKPDEPIVFPAHNFVNQ